MPTKLASIEEYRKLVDSYDTFLFDCDGVIWLGSELIPGVKEVISFLKSSNKNLLYVTNNSTVSRKDYVKKFEKLGLTVTENEIYGSAYATAIYLQKIVKFKAEKEVFIVGGAGIKKELELVGIKVSDKVIPPMSGTEDIKKILPDSKIGAIVCGLDLNMSYGKMAFAHINLMTNEDCLFIATNDDSSFPVENQIFPGAGSILSVLVTSTKKKPAVIGKPYQTMFDSICASHEIDLRRTLMVGDRLDTDIDFGIAAGIDTLVVYTGVTTEEEACNPKNSQATFSMGSFGELSALID
ncbi:hypothetical protein BB559_001502 [Furculomyces boomerangus]|uniref:4-nitrophenylphosphatase n=1 Tax=Furculomyces boomerangus TaxID=61424 RepID=A0A2T9Z1U3_9FUNG|nr:hypothetical protein BB559_001502 [Furculomyces boomerangus]